MAEDRLVVALGDRRYEVERRWCRGAVNGAHGLWGDRAGNLYLAELPPEQVTKLKLLA